MDSQSYSCDLLQWNGSSRVSSWGKWPWSTASEKSGVNFERTSPVRAVEDTFPPQLEWRCHTAILSAEQILKRQCPAQWGALFSISVRKSNPRSQPPTARKQASPGPCNFPCYNGGSSHATCFVFQYCILCDAFEAAYHLHREDCHLISTQRPWIPYSCTGEKLHSFFSGSLSITCLAEPGRCGILPHASLLSSNRLSRHYILISCHS